MAKILFSDKAATTMSGSLASGLGTLNVAPGGGARFPSPTGGDFFYATLYQKDGGGAEINIEVVKITAKPSADSFTISQRDVTNITGYGGGYAYPGAAGTVYVELRWLEKAATAMMQAADMTATNVANTPAGGIAATTVQAALNELDAEKAPLASPALTGTPTAPTAGAGTSTTQLATTAFVSAAIGVHNSVTSAHGVSGSVVGTTDTQTLQNKTLDTTNKFSRSAQIGSSGTATQNFSLEVPASPDGTIKLARGNAGATTQDILTVDAAGKVAFPQGRVYAPGEIIQQTITTDVGSTTTATTATNVTASAILFTPKSTNSTILVTCSGYGYSGANSYSYNFSNLRIHESGSPIGLGAISIGAGAAGTQWIGTTIVQAKLTNSALTQRSFTMYMWNTVAGSAACAMQYQVWTITEIQN